MPENIDRLSAKLDRLDAKFDKLGATWDRHMAEVVCTVKISLMAVTAVQAIVVAAVLVIRLFPSH